MYTPKNIIICLDGTGNQIEENISNVLKLYRTLDKDGTDKQKQVAFYDQGVGTIGQQYTWGVLTQKLWSFLGLATGQGLDKNVLKAYKFISENYHEEEIKYKNGKSKTVRDRIYIFGYSRGAHTARVLAAFIYNMGLIKPAQLHLAGAALTAYKRATQKKGIEELIHFNKITQPYTPAIEFIGVWDTVSSMIVPRKDRLLLPAIEKLRNTRNNPCVKVFRHAMSINENRYMFRLDTWDEPQEFKPNVHSPKKIADQDIFQVWFAGYHGDVGGGNKRADSGISQYPLCWMIKEVMQHGLIFNTRMVDYVALGVPYTKDTEYNYPKPDHKAKIHSSVKSLWLILEILLKFTKYREWMGKGKRFSFFGFYIPWWEPRPIPVDANVHDSAINRRADVQGYNPVNFPTTYNVIEHDGRRSKYW
ncbi:MAG: hypothetical protein COA43_04815 [Robiginitomaculum sp.]|nr:MAG: hypothetical protein COA43_04815 [Robiginitomaculum sp.]